MKSMRELIRLVEDVRSIDGRLDPKQHARTLARFIHHTKADPQHGEKQFADIEDIAKRYHEIGVADVPAFFTALMVALTMLDESDVRAFVDGADPDQWCATVASKVGNDPLANHLKRCVDVLVYNFEVIWKFGKSLAYCLGMLMGYGEALDRDGKSHRPMHEKVRGLFVEHGAPDACAEEYMVIGNQFKREQDAKSQKSQAMLNLYVLAATLVREIGTEKLAALIGDLKRSLSDDDWTT